MQLYIKLATYYGVSCLVLTSNETINHRMLLSISVYRGMGYPAPEVSLSENRNLR